MKITVDNFQSLGHAELEAVGLTVIVGPSDRGKSALVRAMDAALFNRGGDQFVRQGAEFAQVTLSWDVYAPEADALRVAHTVEWQKGGGKNQFTVDGELFSKVGAKAPPALQALGFKEVLIGARQKDDGTLEGGLWMRPQIAGQFDGIFLLDQSGTFLNEVIVKLSRLGVLQRAERQCALDLRQQKSVLKTRQNDLAVATVSAAKLAPAPLLRERLENLRRAEQVIQLERDRLSRLHYLVKARDVMLSRLALGLPATQVLQSAVADTQLQYTQLLSARQALAARATFLALPKKLPRVHKSLKPVEIAQQRWLALQDALGRRVMAVTALDRTERTVQAVIQRGQAAADGLTAFRLENPSCPVCAQPWPGAV